MGHGALINPSSVHHVSAVDEIRREFGLLHAHREHVCGAHGFAYIALLDHTGGQSGAGGVSAADYNFCIGGKTHGQ